MSSDEPRTGDKIVVGNEIALVLARAGPHWLVLRKSGQVRAVVTNKGGTIKSCETIWRRN